jgi:cbb3-type cytochrome oxidase maturation protein
VSVTKTILPAIFETQSFSILSALFILIGISILVAGSFLAAFLWSVKSGQYDDDYTPSIRMLFEDTKEKKSETIQPKNQQKNK